ncbi:CheR family methyltransferase [Massilia glaciei]|uniref:Chemotaxis protein n=1 Tax=Massilia glaciei TaxID=1524097 RepID=A0A2U2HE92_9BURK|nr:CheR family methyltransferase [Massilia glaciei]PWF41752.1 chemotaxis protein [Massilia glaciei]
MHTALATEELEIDLLLEALFQCYGFDFRGHDRAALKRKLESLMARHGLATVSALQERVLHEAGAGPALLRALSVQHGQPFDDPAHARALRSVLPGYLRGSAMPRIWLAECAGAGEAWTLAIVLAEEALLARTEIFATVSNEDLLADARGAGFPAARMAEYEDNYARSGGTGKLADYLSVEEGRAVLLPHLRARITWAQYNLVTDASFNEFQVIVGRNALPDFGPVLRQRALRLFHESLSLFGALAIDRVDDGDAFDASFQAMLANEPWYKRIA